MLEAKKMSQGSSSATKRSDDEDYEEDGRWDSVSLGSSHRRSGSASNSKAILSSSAKQRPTLTARHAHCRSASMPIPPKQQKDVTLSAATLYQGVSGKTYGRDAKNVNTLTSRKFQTNPRVPSPDIVSKCAATSTGKQSVSATRISQKQVPVLIREREIFKATIEEYEEELLELERKLWRTKEELQYLIGESSTNWRQKKRLKDKLKSQDSKLSAVEGYKLKDRFKIETWYFLMKEEAMLHIRFEKYLESCSFITHDSTPATVIPHLENELELLELKFLPSELIKTGVQRRINRLKKLEEHEIVMKFFRDMIAKDYIQKFWDASSEDLRSYLKAEEKFSYLNYLDDGTFRAEFQILLSLFSQSFKGDIEHMIRTLEQSLNEKFDLAYREILMSCEIVEKDVVYYDAFDELEKEFGKHWFEDSKGISSHNISAAGLKSCNKQVAVMGDQETRNGGKHIERPGDMDYPWVGLHKWTIKGDRVSKLTAAFTFQTRHGEKSKKLPNTGLIRRAQNTHKTERQRLRSHIDILETEIVKQLRAFIERQRLRSHIDILETEISLCNSISQT